MEPNDLINERVRQMIADAVYLGVMKAAGVYLLISFVVGILLYVWRVS